MPIRHNRARMTHVPSDKPYAGHVCCVEPGGEKAHGCLESGDPGRRSDSIICGWCNPVQEAGPLQTPPTWGSRAWQEQGRLEPEGDTTTAPGDWHTQSCDDPVSPPPEPHSFLQTVSTCLRWTWKGSVSGAGRIWIRVLMPTFITT